MKSTIAKGALALSVLGFTFGSNVVYEQSKWQPSIFRTIANAVENEALTEENLAAELESLTSRVSEHKEVRAVFEAKLNAEETSLSDLISMRDDELEPLWEEGLNLLTRSRDFHNFFSDKEEHELKAKYEEVASGLGEIHPAEIKESLVSKISTIKERELLEQKAAIAATNERLCENKGLLNDIKAQIAELLKDKEEVVAEVEEEDVDADTNADSGFSTDVATYADFFAHIQQQQRAFFEMSTPSFLAPAGDSNSMLMMLSLMNRNRFQAQAPRTQVNTYYMGGMGGFGGFPGFPAPQVDSRGPANSAVPSFLQNVDGNEYTRLVPTMNRNQNFGSEFFDFN